MGRTACTEPQCLYKGASYICVIIFHILCILLLYINNLCVCVNFLINVERSLNVKSVGFFMFCSDIARLTGNPKDDYENL